MLPTDLDILAPPNSSMPLYSHQRAKTLPPCAHSLCAISFSWCGNCRSMPPAWMSMVSPRCAAAIAEHSMCQPGRPRPHGESQPGRSEDEGFHNTKSPGLRLRSEEHTSELQSLMRHSYAV